MKKILMIATGGTIASRKTEAGMTPLLTTDELLRYVPEVPTFCTVDSIQLCNLQHAHPDGTLAGNGPNHSGMVRPK